MDTLAPWWELSSQVLVPVRSICFWSQPGFEPLSPSPLLGNALVPVPTAECGRVEL